MATNGKTQPSQQQQQHLQQQQQRVRQSYRVSRLSPAPPDAGPDRPVSPGGGSIRSYASVSTLDSVTYDGAPPPLPAVVAVRACALRKRPPGSEGPGWGFVLRGTTSEYAEGMKVYTCQIDSVHESGAAKVRRVECLLVCVSEGERERGTERWSVRLGMPVCIRGRKR